MTHSNPCLLCDRCKGIFRSPCILILCNAVSNQFLPCHWREMLKITTVLTHTVSMTPIWPTFFLLLSKYLSGSVCSSSGGFRASKGRMNTVYRSYWSLISKVNAVFWSSTRVCLSPDRIQFTPSTNSVNPYLLVAAYTVLNWTACQINSPGSQCCASRCSWTNERVRKWWKLFS